MSSPPYDAVDHKMRLATPCSFNLHLPLVTVGEPIKWETSLKVTEIFYHLDQLLVDILMTDAHLSAAPSSITHPHLPIMDCNMGLPVDALVTGPITSAWRTSMRS